MTNTRFSKKCEIIRDFQEIAEDKHWAADYFRTYDLGVPFAIGVADGLISISHPDAEAYIEGAYDALCALLGVDKYGDFDSIDELMDFYEQG